MFYCSEFDPPCAAWRARGAQQSNTSKLAYLASIWNQSRANGTTISCGWANYNVTASKATPSSHEFLHNPELLNLFRIQMVFESLNRDLGFGLNARIDQEHRKSKYCGFGSIHQRISPNKMFRYALPSVFHAAKFSEGVTPYVTRLRLSPGKSAMPSRTRDPLKGP